MVEITVLVEILRIYFIKDTFMKYLFDTALKSLKWIDHNRIKIMNKENFEHLKRNSCKHINILQPNLLNQDSS